MQKVSILFWLNRSKNNNGRAPIYCRITVNGDRAPELSTGKFLETTIDKEGNVKCKRWDYEVEKNGKKILTNDQEVRGSQEDAILINRYLTSMRNRIQKIADDLEDKGEMYSALKIHSLFTGKGGGNHKLLECYRLHIIRMQELIGNGYTQTTVDQTESRFNNLSFFIKDFYKTNDIYLSQVNREFVDDFCHWGKTKTGFYEGTKRKIVPWIHNSALKQLSQLKTITDECFSKKWIKEDPFAGYNFDFDAPKFKFLSEDEVKLIEDFKFPTISLEEQADVFLFGCFTSLEYSGLKALDESLLVKQMIKGKLVISIMKYRKKTGEPVYIPLLDKPKAILEKYKDHPVCLASGKLLPVLTNQGYNKNLKIIANLCGINKHLTSHVARHTAATFLLNNGVSEASVCEIMGLASTKVLRSTYGKLLRTTVQNEMAQLQERLSGAM